MKAAIFLFCRTKNMAKPWAEAGVTCYLVDVQHTPGESREGNYVCVERGVVTQSGAVGRVYGGWDEPCRVCFINRDYELD